MLKTSTYSNKEKKIRHLCVRVHACVCRMNFPLSQQGLNTHRVNIIGLNPGWVDIGLVWVRDFIFLSLTLVFAGCDLNSIGVICLSKARTGTCRSWVCVHCDQGNSIRRHPYCVCGWDSSVDIERGGIRGWVTLHQGNAPFQGRGFTMVEGRHHRWTLLRMHCLHILATSQKRALSVSFPPVVSSLYRMASVSSPAERAARASFQGTHNALYLRPITLPLREILTPRKAVKKQLWS